MVLCTHHPWRQQASQMSCIAMCMDHIQGFKWLQAYKQTFWEYIYMSTPPSNNLLKHILISIFIFSHYYKRNYYHNQQVCNMYKDLLLNNGTIILGIQFLSQLKVCAWVCVPVPYSQCFLWSTDTHFPFHFNFSFKIVP